MLNFWSIVLLFFMFCIIQLIVKVVELYVIGRVSRVQQKQKIDDLIVSAVRGFYQFKSKVGGSND